jgi:hypothetical protein
MSAPARVERPSRRNPTKSAQPAGGAAGRGRSAGGDRAYARRAQRAGEPPQRAERVGPKSDRGRYPAGRVSFVVLVMALLVAGVVLTLWFATQSTADSYRLEQIKESNQNMSDAVQQLQQAVAQGESPESLAARAKQLGLVPAGDPAHIVVNPNGSVSIVGTPSVATSPPPPPAPSSSAPSSTPSAPPSSSTSPASTSAAPPPAGG